MQRFQDALFNTIYCSKLVVDPETTALKWNPTKKARGLYIKGAIDTVKTDTTGRFQGILGAQKITIGTTTKSWYILTYEAVDMHMGLALHTQDLNTIDGAIIDYKTNAHQNDKIIFTLSESNLRIQQGNSITIHDLQEHAGKEVYIWACTMETDTMSIKLMEVQHFTTSVDTSGGVRMTGRNNDIVDFSLGDISRNSGVSSNTFNDSTLTINNADAGPGVTAGTAGIIIHRGSGTPSYQLLFNENTQQWTNGEKDNQQYTIAEHSGVFTENSIPGYDINGRLSDANGFSSTIVVDLKNNWANINSINQQLSNTSDVEFNSVKKSISGVLIADTTITHSISIFDTTDGPITVTMPDNTVDTGIRYTIVLQTYGGDLTIAGTGIVLNEKSHIDMISFSNEWQAV